MTSSPTCVENELAGIRILIVEDNDDSADTLEELLTMAGATVAVARDGSRALQLAKTFAPAVVVLDLELPEMHGSAVAARLREQAGADKAPRIIAVTGYGLEEARERGADGFFAYFVKPIDLSDLIEAILAT